MYKSKPPAVCLGFEFDPEKKLKDFCCPFETPWAKKFWKPQKIKTFYK